MSSETTFIVRTREEDRRQVLLEAEEAVCSDRNQDYGDPEENFADIANLWTAYAGHQFTRTDVAVFMTLVKIARMKTSPSLKDHWVDIAGYAACGYPSALADQND
jgi:hypothetical protein